MDAPVNRVSVLMVNWRDLEGKLNGFRVPNGLGEKEVLKQQLDFLSRGLNRILAAPLPHENAHLALLRSTVAKLEKSIYPNPILRFLIRLKLQTVDRPVQMKAFRQMKEDNLSQLKKFMLDRGFGSVSEQLEKRLDYERSRVEVGMSGQLDQSKRLELTLVLEKDPFGRYQPDLISARMFEHERPIFPLDIPLENQVDVAMVVNLMLGRAVCVEGRNGLGEPSEKWLSLDVANPGANILQFNADYGYDVGELLRQMSKDLGISGLYDSRLIEELKKGNQISFLAGPPFDRKLIMEADPATKQITLLNEHGSQIDAYHLREEKKAYQVEMTQGASQLNVPHKRERSNIQQNGIGH